MKMSITSILLVCLIISCLAGCNQAVTPTPTDAPVASVETADSVESDNSVVLQEEPIQSQEETVSKDKEAPDVESEVPQQQNNDKQSSIPKTEPKPQKEHKPSVGSTVSDTPDQSDEQQNDDTAELPPYDPLTFTTVSQLETFYQKGVAHDKNQTAALQAFHAQQNSYLRPIAVKEWKLKKIVTRASGMTYRYVFPVNKDNLQKEYYDLKISVNYVDNVGYNELFDHLKSNEAGGQITVDNIEYVYAPHADNKGFSIAWKQFGITHTALLYNHTDQIEKFIPLLKIERVTLGGNSDHVVK